MSFLRLLLISKHLEQITLKYMLENIKETCKAGAIHPKAGTPDSWLLSQTSGDDELQGGTVSTEDRTKGVKRGPEGQTPLETTGGNVAVRRSRLLAKQVERNCSLGEEPGRATQSPARSRHFYTLEVRMNTSHKARGL